MKHNFHSLIFWYNNMCFNFRVRIFFIILYGLNLFSFYDYTVIFIILIIFLLLFVFILIYLLWYFLIYIYINNEMFHVKHDFHSLVFLCFTFFYYYIKNDTFHVEHADLLFICENMLTFFFLLIYNVFDAIMFFWNQVRIGR